MIKRLKKNNRYNMSCVVNDVIRFDKEWVLIEYEGPFLVLGKTKTAYWFLLWYSRETNYHNWLVKKANYELVRDFFESKKPLSEVFEYHQDAPLFQVAISHSGNVIDIKLAFVFELNERRLPTKNSYQSVLDIDVGIWQDIEASESINFVDLRDFAIKSQNPLFNRVEIIPVVKPWTGTPTVLQYKLHSFCLSLSNDNDFQNRLPESKPFQVQDNICNFATK